MEKGKNKFSECVYCKDFFKCKHKKNKPDKCLNFKERKDIDK